MIALEAKDLKVGYGKADVLDGVNVKVDEGAIVSLVGPNGAGKTTLLLALTGLLPARGTVSYFGEPMANVSVEDRVARGLCLVPERRELFGDLSVSDNLELGGFSRWMRGERQLRESLEEVFERFPRLRERQDKDASTLSGGERQMLALGRALMAAPRLLLLDEPSLGLAPLIVREIFHIISRLRDNGVSLLVVEQNARAALEVSDYAYVLENGRVSMEGAASDLIDNPRVIDTYLGRRQAY
ncbi:ABC transporter ATP-binding protein [Mesorhizobium sp. Z1-4]|uniref:ABC transporter ATP-binding protein n=1 Tax=Mesorhizobium sp. Z1-4 TaxID=2448478 RepID=UPI000FDC2407|nr:ABC transporter ATP-binding protein [Mesorhizobium sp. Z1-4]